MSEVPVAKNANSRSGARTAFWITLARAALATALGLALILQPDKTRPMLVNTRPDESGARLQSGFMSQQLKHTPRQGFIERFLDPIDRLTEAIYAVLIVMTFTMAYRAIDANAAGLAPMSQLVTNLAIAAFGCAVAWGIIDGAMYVLLGLLERGESNQLFRRLKTAPNEQSAIDAIARQLDDALEPITTDEERQALYKQAYVRLRDREPKKVGFKSEDFFGALGVMLIAILAALPLVIPLVLFRDNAALALRASNLMAIVMLFLFGYRWAKYSGSNPFKVGFALAALGVGMVLVAIPLGG